MVNRENPSKTVPLPLVMKSALQDSKSFTSKRAREPGPVHAFQCLVNLDPFLRCAVLLFFSGNCNSRLSWLV